jgi:hypothetical protein
VRNGSAQRSDADTGTKLGQYGSGTLWFLKNREGTFITFNELRIAKRSADKKTCAALDAGWNKNRASIQWDGRTTPEISPPTTCGTSAKRDHRD